MRPFRFMVGSRDVVDGRMLAERARWAESIGCSHVAVHDHLASQLAPVPLLTAVAMATGAAETLGADYALAVTGFAGSAETGTSGNPVGTIFIGLFSPAGVWSKKLSYPGPRSTVKVRAVNAALDWLRRELLRAQRGATTPARRVGVMQ